jgi:hypothetical protein
MQRISSFMPATAAVFSVLACVAMARTSTAAVPLTAASSASAFNLSLNINGQKEALGNQVYAFGSAPPAYKSRTDLPSYSKTYTAPGGSASIVASGGSIVSTASSAGPSGGQIVSGATSSAGTLKVTVSTILGDLITISSTGIVSHASFTKTRAGVGTPAGNANIGKLIINAPLLGINNKSFSGAPKPNQVLFQTPDKSVTIYLNRQTKTEVRGKPTSITIDAVDIVVSNSAIANTAVSAELVIGTAMAN